MKITDGKKTVEIIIHRWNGNGYDPDFSLDYFDASSLPYDVDTGIYTVDDVDYCIYMARSTDPDGACSKVDDYGYPTPDGDMVVDVTEL